MTNNKLLCIWFPQVNRIWLMQIFKMQLILYIFLKHVLEILWKIWDWFDNLWKINIELEILYNYFFIHHSLHIFEGKTIYIFLKRHIFSWKGIRLQFLILLLKGLKTINYLLKLEQEIKTAKKSWFSIIFSFRVINF